MRKFRERNLFVVAAVASVVLLVAGLFALNFARFSERTYRADLQSGVGLAPGDVVTIAGVRVGAVSSLGLAREAGGAAVARVAFTVSSSYSLPSGTSVVVKVLNPVGVEYLELVPAGSGRLSGTIPVARTTIPGTLVGDLDTLTRNVQQTDIAQLVRSLQVLTTTFAANTPTQTRAALDGVAQLSAVLAGRSTELQQLIAQSSQLTGLLDSRSSQIVDLLGQSSLLLQVLEQRKAALDQVLTTTTALTERVDHVISGDRSVLDPLLANLSTVSSYLARDSSNLSEAIPLLAALSRYTANVTGSGPYADFVAPTLVVPDNLVAQCAAIGNLDPQRGCRP